MIVVQFSMSFVIRLLFVSSLFIISHPLAFVKRFFKLFWSFLRLLSDSLPRLSAARILYHIRFRLSRGFLNFFQVFLQFLSVPLILSWTAWILYHSQSALSSAFSNFFQFFSTSGSVFLCLSDSRIIISQLSCLVNTFLKVFSSFSLFLTSYLLLLIYSHTHPDTSVSVSYPYTYLLF